MTALGWRDKGCFGESNHAGEAIRQLTGKAIPRSPPKNGGAFLHPIEGTIQLKPRPWRIVLMGMQFGSRQRL